MSENFERIIFLRLLHRVPARNLIIKKDRHAAVVRFAKLCVVEREREIAIVIVIVFARVDAQCLRRIDEPAGLRVSGKTFHPRRF